LGSVADFLSKLNKEIFVNRNFRVEFYIDFPLAGIYSICRAGKLFKQMVPMRLYIPESVGV